MLSGERQRQIMVKDNNRSNQQKRATLPGGAHFFCTFLCRCFARIQRETSRNFLVTHFMEEMSYVFSFTFFDCRSFSLCIGGRQHFPFCDRRYNIFMLFFQQKNVSVVFYLSLQTSSSVALFLFVLRWPASYFLFLSVFLLLYIPNLWTSVLI